MYDIDLLTNKNDIMETLFIGREKEQRMLKEYLGSSQSEFIAVYGRRRVGKTFLIKHVIQETAAYYVAGMHQATLKMQLENFIQPMRLNGFKQRKPSNWLQAFFQLEQYLERLPEGNKIIFIDEMPWMDTQHSHFVSGLEHFWNSWAANRSDIKLIVCGSATSWIINNIIKNKGGLHNRVTHTISLAPFTLRECKNYFDAKGFNLQHRQLKECYMIYGGVPYYLSKINKNESIAQSVDRLIFAENGELHNEFHSVYNSLYTNASDHIKVVYALATKGKGLKRRDIKDCTELSNNGNLTTVLEELEQCGFIRAYEPFMAEYKRRRRSATSQHRSPNCLYQLIDPFTLFYFQVFVGHAHNPHYWTQMFLSQEHSTWAGLSFEMLCLNHSEQIKQALSIAGMQSEVLSWFGQGEFRKAQIDMLINRSDDCINICEMKYYNDTLRMTQQDEDDLRRKVNVFLEQSRTHKQIIITMITAHGVEHNTHFGLVQQELTIDDIIQA